MPLSDSLFGDLWNVTAAFASSGGNSVSYSKWAIGKCAVAFQLEIESLSISRQKLLQQKLLRQTRSHPFRGADAEIGEHQSYAPIRLRIVKV